MQPQTNALRAISSLYAQELINSLRKTITIILFAILVVVIALTIFLSAWWLVFLIPLFVGFVGTYVASFVAMSAARIAAPTMNTAQRTAAQSYVASIHEVTDDLQTAQWLIAIKVCVDIYKRRWKDGYIVQTTKKSAGLKKDFDTLVKLFAGS